MELTARRPFRSSSPDEKTKWSQSSSSGQSTPIAPDAPPSHHATSSARQQIRASVKARRFPSIEYAARDSHFDPKLNTSEFRGFFVLFWVALAIMVITSLLRHLKETGYPFRVSQWENFKANIVELGPVDLAMVASSMLVLPMHRAFMASSGPLRWSNGGKWVQSTFEALWLVGWVSWPFLRNWSWTAQVFFTLHFLTIFMKMHSFAFYNGHLSETRHQLLALDSKMSSTTAQALKSISESALNSKSNTENTTSAADLTSAREALAFELTSPLGHVTYPTNLSLANYAEFVCFPTLCYELEYPRLKEVRWLNVFRKTLAVFGCIFLLIVTSEEFIIPVLRESVDALHHVQNTNRSRGEFLFGLSEPWSTKFGNALVLAETISRLLFPFLVAMLLVFLVIFEYVLGAFAEVTRFADRQFYSDWWNSRDWYEFSRKWNKPVHHFLSRHVYAASLQRASRQVAMSLTFFVSALAHELVMASITKKLRGYSMVAMMMQIPIVMVQRSKLVRSQELLNNVLFWCSIIFGLALMCALYVLF